MHSSTKPKSRFAVVAQIFDCDELSVLMLPVRVPCQFGPNVGVPELLPIWSCVNAILSLCRAEQHIYSVRQECLLLLVIQLTLGGAKNGCARLS